MKIETNITTLPLIINNRKAPNIRIIPNVGLSICTAKRSRKQGGNCYQVVSLAELIKAIKSND